MGSSVVLITKSQRLLNPCSNHLVIEIKLCANNMKNKEYHTVGTVPLNAPHCRNSSIKRYGISVPQITTCIYGQSVTVTIPSF